MDQPAWAARYGQSGWRRLGTEAFATLRDFNVAHTPRDVHPKERREVIGQLAVVRALLDDFLDNDLVDVGRLAAPDDESL